MSGEGQATQITQQDFEAWLSAPRLKKYLDVAGGDLNLAMRTYVWNSRVSVAALEDVFHLEVALRNAYDRELVALYPDWALDPDNSPLLALTQGFQAAVAKQVELNSKSITALRQAQRGLGASPSHDQVVAATTFGFWAKLTDRVREPTLWNPMLHRSFGGAPSRGDVHERVARVNKFRNRLAHSEPVFSSRTGLRNRLKDVDELLQLVAPSAAGFIQQASRVEAGLRSCPVAGLV